MHSIRKTKTKKKRQQQLRRRRRLCWVDSISTVSLHRRHRRRSSLIKLFYIQLPRTKEGRPDGGEKRNEQQKVTLPRIFRVFRRLFHEKRSDTDTDRPLGIWFVVVMVILDCSSFKTWGQSVQSMKVLCTVPSFPRMIDVVDGGCDEAGSLVERIEQGFDAIALQEEGGRL